MLGQGGGGSGGERPSFPTTWLLLKIGLFTFTSCVKQRIFEIYMRLLPKIGLGGSCPSRIPSSLGLGSEASLASCYLIWNRLNWYWCIDEVNSFTNRLSEFVNHRPSGMSTKWTHRLNGYRPSEPIDQVGCRPSESSIKWVSIKWTHRSSGTSTKWDAGPNRSNGLSIKWANAFNNLQSSIIFRVFIYCNLVSLLGRRCTVG